MQNDPRWRSGVERGAWLEAMGSVYLHFVQWKP